MALIFIAGLTLVTLVVTATGAGPDAVAQYIADVQTYVHPFSHIPYTPKEADRELSDPSALVLHRHCPLLLSASLVASTQPARSDHPCAGGVLVVLLDWWNQYLKDHPENPWADADESRVQSKCA